MRGDGRCADNQDPSASGEAARKRGSALLTWLILSVPGGVRKTPPAEGGGRLSIDRGGMELLWSAWPILPPSGIRINDN